MRRLTKPAPLLEGLMGWSMQMGVWRYAVQGEITETTALIAEGHSELLSGAAWDETARDLAGRMVAYGNAPYVRVKDAAALPWVTEHILRGHAPWTGFADATISPQSTPCCVCPPTCETDDTGDTCIDASCAVCLHGCPAGLDRPCCRDIDRTSTDVTRTGAST